MRLTSAGMLLLLTLYPAWAAAQVRGEVASIGFDNHYRPDCWTPMLVKLVAQTEQSANYVIEVIQEDLDQDLVLARRTISLSGTPAGQGAREQRFWMYFRPQPRGLPDRGEGLKALQDQLRVFLCDSSGKQITRLPITSTVLNIDPPNQIFDVRPGVKLILCIAEGNQIPPRGEYENVVGVNENVLMLPLRVDQLPEDPRGFDAVDAIIWFSGDARQLVLTEKIEALRQFVRTGGQLVICQSSQRDALLPLGDLLPVVVTGISDRTDLDPLRQIVDEQTIVPATPVKTARARAKPDATVARWITWDDDSADASPYLVRKAYGLGSVTWIAQNLGDPAITSAIQSGWPWIWDFVFDWRNDTQIIADPQAQESIRLDFSADSFVDLGTSLLGGMEHTRRASLLITLAVVFFLVYWLVAGPGIYFYLAARRRAHWNWFLFGASALAATALTVLLVRLVLRGDPALHHVSIVQVAPGQPAIVRSRFGLYIPRDGRQQIALRDADSSLLNYIVPFAHHPAHGGINVEFPARMQYEVPIRLTGENQDDESASIRVPFRSTLKKFEALWCGTLSGSVEGSARLIGGHDRGIDGAITNGTAHTLRNVYVAYAYPQGDGRNVDQVMFIKSWEPGVTLKLRQEFIRMKTVDTAPGEGRGQPERDPALRGVLGWSHDWDRYWFARTRRGALDDGWFDDSRSTARASFPMLSLFDHLPPRRNGDQEQPKRFELLRHGARHLDLSHLLSAGKVLVLAEADGPLPFPLEVQGDIIGGEGTVLYQFVLPLDRSAVERPPATQPEE